MIKYSPCYQCAERHELCHSDCERYKEYQELLKQQNANNRYIAEADSCLIHAIKKRIREKNERKHGG